MFAKKLKDMKRSISKKVCIMTFICISCVSGFLLKEKRQTFSDLAFSNIEALASGESGGNDCYGRGSLYCNGGYNKYQIYSIK